MRAFTYTHCSVDIPLNREIVQKACKNGFTINFSCEKLDQVEKAVKNGCPAVLTVRSMQGAEKIINGIKYKKCSFQSCGMTCVECKKCRLPNRKYVVVFEEHSHASKEKKAAIKLLDI